MKTILIIDDEEGFCSLVKENLEMGGKYSVIHEVSGKSGLRAAESRNPDLILLDVMMDDMDGLEVLKRLKESRRTMSIPVIMLSAQSAERVKKEAASLYNEDYITKPVSMATLKARVEDLLSRISPTADGG